MEEGPWYCAPLLAKVLMCSGGLAIDLKSRVLSVVDDRPIPGLFAAGEITGGLNGKGDAGACGLMDRWSFINLLIWKGYGHRLPHDHIA